MLILDVAESRTSLPDGLGFLEMFEAGNLEQLNVRVRWNKRAGSSTLAAQVGVDPQGEPFYLNLHEKFHGPHGLIAGTTEELAFIKQACADMTESYSGAPAQMRSEHRLEVEPGYGYLIDAGKTDLVKVGLYKSKKKEGDL